MPLRHFFGSGDQCKRPQRLLSAPLDGGRTPKDQRLLLEQPLGLGCHLSRPSRGHGLRLRDREVHAQGADRAEGPILRASDDAGRSKPPC